MLQKRDSHKPSAELLNSFLGSFSGCFNDRKHDNPGALENIEGKDTLYYPTSIMPESTLNAGMLDSQTSRRDLESTEMDNFSLGLHQNNLPFPDQFPIEERKEVQPESQNSLKHVQMEDIYSAPGEASTFQQDHSWNGGIDLFSFPQPWPNSGFNIGNEAKMNTPRTHQDSAYQSMDPSDKAINFGGEADIPSMDNKDICFGKWRDEGFRFCAILDASTAMLRNTEDTTLTYLNKGQVYNVSIMDSKVQSCTNRTIKYRAFIRVSFDQQQPRSNPAACWRLWKESRSLNESSQKDEQLFAVKYAGSTGSRFQCQIEQESFDGFAITWTANPATGPNLFNIPLRLHFLSTDFTRSKGVKGMPMRLCAKIEQLPEVPGDSSPIENPEICFCKVQLFRDHGAERKLSNDSGNLNRAMDKLRQKISDASLKPITQKRKRGKGPELATHTSESIGLPNAETGQSRDNGLEIKMDELRDMSISSLPTTTLALRGSEEDDPDVYPVYIPELVDNDHAHESSPQSNSSTVYSKGDSAQSSETSTYDGQMAGVEHISPAKAMSKNERVGFTNSTAASNQISTEQPNPPVACFYIRLMIEDCQEIYRAIYLSERTVQNLALAISGKYGLTLPSRFNIIHVGNKGIKVLVDNDFVQQIPEGQHMTIQLDSNPSMDQNPNFGEMQLIY